MTTALPRSSLRSGPALRALVGAFGPAPEVVALDNFEPDRPGPGQVRVRMTARSINPSDHVTIAGAYAWRTALPFVPGFEGVGVVEELGAGVSACAIGDRVLPIGSAGAWQDVKIADAHWCFPVAADLTDAQAAASYINPLTAWLLLHGRAALAPGMALAVNAAGSAIGRMLIRMANAAGVRPVALIRREATRERLTGLDLTAIVVTGDESPAAALREVLDDGGLDIALDAVGGPCGEALALALKPGGRFLHYGLLSGQALPADLPLRRPDLRFALFHLREWVHGQDRETIAAHLAQAAALVRSGVAETAVEASYPLREITQALRHDLQPGRSGKILITG